MLHKQDILIALACSLAIFFLAFFIADGRPALSNPDGAAAIHLARNLADGDGFIMRGAREDGPPQSLPFVTKPPFFAFLIAILSVLGLDPRIGAELIVLTSSSLSTGLFYFLARRGLPKVVAILATLLFGVQGEVLRWGTVIHEEMVLVFMVLATLLALTSLIDLKEKGKGLAWWGWGGLGVLCGATQLTSYQGFPLLLVVTGFVVWSSLSGSKSIWTLGSFASGLGLVGLYPLMRFVFHSLNGLNPSFDHGTEATWMLMGTSIIHALQTVLVGRMVVWMNQPDIFHYVLLIGAYALLLLVVWSTGSRYRAFRPVAVFVAAHVTTLFVRSASTGAVYLEPRFLAPVDGLIVLILVAFFYRLIRSEVRAIRGGAMVGAAIFVVAYIHGQYDNLNKQRARREALGESGDYCHAPKTINWVRENVPASSIVFSSQCGYQLLADVNSVFWLRIPPADEYKSSPRYAVRWGESDFMRINELTGARWVVLLRGDKGDPLLEKPGYGPFVTEMFAGRPVSKNLRMVSDLGDGVVYSIELNDEAAQN